MAETAVVEPDLNAVEPSSPPQKRKRGTTESASPESRRSKRGAPTATMSATLDAANQANQGYLNDAQMDDFNALQQVQQATAGHDISDHASAVGTAAAALGSMYPTIHVPQSTEETFAAQVIPGHDHEEAEASFNAGDVSQADGLPTPDPNGNGMQGANGVAREGRFQSNSASKPAVGSEEWHKQRKDNHKEVERRRRETINEGINELAKIVPGCEKNKGSILARAVAFITQLKDNETQNIEKWTLEKLLTEQAIAELSTSNEKLKAELERAFRELELYKQQATDLNLPEPSLKTETGAAT